MVLGFGFRVLGLGFGFWVFWALGFEFLDFGFYLNLEYLGLGFEGSEYNINLEYNRIF